MQVFHSDRFYQYMLDRSSLIGATMRRVALINTVDPERAYMLTNSLQSLWTTYSEVHVVEEYKNVSVRSTSVGDMLVEGSPGDPGSKHLVIEPIGFREMTREEICSITYALPE